MAGLTCPDRTGSNREDSNPYQSLRPEESPLYGSAGHNGDSLSPEQLQTLISEYEERAVFEEREGCFGLAEVFWKRAFAISTTHFPEDKVTARVARSLGLFLHRFLPDSAQPIAFLRTAVDIEKRLDASADTANALLDLSKVLIVCSDYCEEAKSILTSLIEGSKDTELTLRATTSLAQIRFVHGAYFKAEEILRANVAQAKALFPSSKLYAEVLSLLGDVLVSLERLPEGISLLTESLAISKYRFPHLFLATFQRILTAFQSEQMFTELHSFIASEDVTGLHPYTVAELFTMIAESSFPHERITWYLRALALYRSVQPQSWYVANVLARVTLSFTSVEGNSLLFEAGEQLSDLMPALPTVTTMIRMKNCMPCFVKDDNLYLMKLEELFKRESGDEIVSGEALLELYHISTDYKMHWYVNRSVQSYIERFPATRLTALLYEQNNNEEGIRNSLAIYRQLRMPSHTIFIALESLAQCLLRKVGYDRILSGVFHGRHTVAAPLQEDKKRALLSLLREASDIYLNGCDQSAKGYSLCASIAELYAYFFDFAEAENLHQRISLKCVAERAKNRIDAEYFANIGLIYAAFKRDVEAETYLRRAAEIIMIEKRWTMEGCLILSSLLSFYNYTNQREKHRHLFSDCIDYMNSALSQSMTSILRSII